MAKTAFTQSAVIFLLLFFTLTSIGCTANTEPVTGQDQNLVILQGVDATTLDPAMHSEGPTGNIERQIFDTFLNQNAAMKIEPWIARRWKMIDATTWQFELRNDVYFQDGKQLTANDVKFSIERILNKENNSPQISNFSAISKIKTGGDFSIEITTAKPYPLLLTRLAGLRVVPKHYVSEVGNSQFSLKPVGSGPYLFEEWVKDEHVILKANEDYWQGSPSIKKISFKPVPEAAARVMALQKGEADIIVNLPPHQISTLEGNSRVEQVDSTRLIMLPITTKNAAVNDIKVREAINYAIDVEGIIDSIFNGRAKVSAQPVGSYDLGYHKGIQPYGYDPDKSRTLLAEAGFHQGLKITMGSPSGRYIMDKEVAEVIKAQLEEVGFEVDLTFQEWGSYVSNILSGSIEYDIWLVGWGSSTFDAGSTLDFWINSERATSYYRVAEETNSLVDMILAEAMTTVDENKRVEKYHQILEQVHEDVAFANLYQQVDLYGVSERVVWSARPDETIRVYTASWK